MEAPRALAIFEELKRNLKRPELPSIFRDPFQVLVITIISQNTNDRNTLRAYQRLEARGLITPKAILEAELKELQEALKIAGLYRNKAKKLKELATILLEAHGGDLWNILRLPLEDAREQLLKLPGVGLKTADVLLLFCAGKPVIPVDTHVNRTAKRLGLADYKADYEEVRRSLQNLYPPEHYLDVHLLLISLGRTYCKAGRPLCDECPLRNLCPTANAMKKS